jgi:hypothetical protein
VVIGIILGTIKPATCSWLDKYNRSKVEMELFHIIDSKIYISVSHWGLF